MQNIQTSNVGNFGDIIKHALLVQLIQFLKNRSRSNFTYVDLHTFLMQYAANFPTWSSNVSQLDDMCKEYIDIEREHYSKTNNYLCSSGIAAQLLEKHSHANLILSEQCAETKKTLKSQLDILTELDHQIMNHSTELSSYLKPSSNTALFVLIDPFKLDQKEWSEHMSAIINVLQQSTNMDVVIEVFNYDERSVDEHWKDFPIDESVLKRVYATKYNKYHLAVFTTLNIADQVSLKVFK